MLLTALMFVVLVVIFALMFGLVRFTENVIAVPDVRTAGDGDSKRADALTPAR